MASSSSSSNDPNAWQQAPLQGSQAEQENPNPALAQPPASPSRPRSRFLQRLPFSEATKAIVNTLAEHVKHDQDISGQLLLLEAKAIGEAKRWSTVSISAASWGRSNQLKSQLMSESDDLIEAVSSVNPEALYMSERAQVIQFNQGLTPIKSFLTMVDDCALFIPLFLPGSAQVLVYDESRPGARIDLAESKDTAFIISGRCSLALQHWRAGEDIQPMVCVIFCLAAGASG